MRDETTDGKDGEIGAQPRERVLGKSKAYKSKTSGGRHSAIPEKTKGEKKIVVAAQRKGRKEKNL